MEKSHIEPRRSKHIERKEPKPKKNKFDPNQFIIREGFYECKICKSDPKFENMNIPLLKERQAYVHFNYHMNKCEIGINMKRHQYKYVPIEGSIQNMNHEANQDTEIVVEKTIKIIQHKRVC